MDTKETRIKEIGLYAQNLLTILDSIVEKRNYFGRDDLHDHLMRKRIFTLIMDKIFKRGRKIIRKMDMALIWSHWSAHSAYYPRRSGLIGKSSHSRPVDLTIMNCGQLWEPILKVWLKFQIWSQKKSKTADCIWRTRRGFTNLWYPAKTFSTPVCHYSTSSLHNGHKGQVVVWLVWK